MNPQFRLLHLTHCIAWQRIGHKDAFRNLELRQAPGQSRDHLTLIEAWRSVLDARPEAELRLVGRSGGTLANVRERVAELGLQDSVTVILDVPHDEVAGLIRKRRMEDSIASVSKSKS